jgi:prepilin-type N-terminal cleavage/methylation domain-containing protein/prepilin-type processing-associated H-X9-DG protein
MSRRQAFTLVELLVVIGIIALLIALLMPALRQGRRAANTVACASNMRSIMQGVQMYVAESKGFIPGSPNTSGRYLLTGYSEGNCPGISQVFDWQAPVARYMNIRFEEGGTMAQRVQRIQTLVGHSAMSCPENEFFATPFGAVNFGVAPWLSYSMSTPFLFTRPTGSDGDGIRTSRTWYMAPAGYVPKITKVGDTARKICLAEGARFTTTNPPTMNFEYDEWMGGAFADAGAWSRFSRAWDRSHAPGNGGAGALDPRLFTYRHGTQGRKRGSDMYKMNVAFFDGHVELMGDLQSARPEFWAPKGTEMTINSSEVFPDVLRTHFGSASFSNPRWVAP